MIGASIICTYRQNSTRTGSWNGGRHTLQDHCFSVYSGPTPPILSTSCSTAIGRIHTCLRVAAREWPDAELVPELKGILPSSQPFSNEDRKPLRNAGISAPLERDGKVVAPIGFMSLAGTSIQTKSEVNRILGSLKRFLDQLTENPDYVADLLRQHGLPIPSNLDLHFMFFETGGYGVIEAQTSLAIRLDPPSPNLDKKARDQFRLRECFATLSLVRAVTSFVRS